MEIVNTQTIEQVSRATVKNAQIEAPLLLWVNVMSVVETSPLADLFSELVNVRILNRKTDFSSNHDKPDFICFEYDYPDFDSLNILKLTRQQHPDIPIIMFTVQHSEELAIWALRNRVWDYHYKPVSKRNVRQLGREILNFHKNKKINNNQSYNQQHFQSSYPNEVRFKTDNNNHVVIDTALNYLCSHYSEKISEKTVADLCDLSRFQFARQFKKVVGSTFQNYLIIFRIDKAKSLLKNPKLRIHDIAYSVGFCDPAYFTRAFKRITGRSPSNFRADH